MKHLLAPMLLLAPTVALAWGPQGHQAVGAIADQLIAGTPTATQVRKILGNSLRNSAGWADCARSVESKAGQWHYVGAGQWPDCKAYENAASEKALVAFVQRNASRCGNGASTAQCRHKGYHFVDLPIQHPKYDVASPGAGPGDLVHAIDATITVLQGGKSPPPFDIRGQREALRLLVHYVGDVHQPLHVGSIYLDDNGQPIDPKTAQEAHDHANAGGNAIRLESRKLHEQWDDVSDKLFKQMIDGGAAAAKQLPGTPGAPAAWAEAWASDTATVASAAFKDLKIGHKVAGTMGPEWPATATEPAYRQAREALQREQLLKAGARLAQLLRALWP